MGRVIDIVSVIDKVKIKDRENRGQIIYRGYDQ